ncbi:hypothetical protein IMY05_C4944000200 [Salix suchowensis]|nr:hypothetical protein IMY05_C4944000200 [Salix suchowensis]
MELHVLLAYAPASVGFVPLATVHLCKERPVRRWTQASDVVLYRDTVFLHTGSKSRQECGTGARTANQSLVLSQRTVVIVWFHDESYSMRMIAVTRHGTTKMQLPSHMQKAMPGKNHDGYFDSDDILDQVREVMDILEEFYPEYQHVLVYDNAMTHLKRPDGSLSALKMLKNPSKSGKNWLVEVSQRDESGNRIYTTAGSIAKTKVKMHGAKFSDERPQSLYFPDGHIHVDYSKEWRPSWMNAGLAGSLARIRNSLNALNFSAKETLPHHLTAAVTHAV